MREKKKSLRLTKHVIAKLRTFTIAGGGQTNPCAGPGGVTINPSDECKTDGYDDTCTPECHTTRGNIISDPHNPCGGTGNDGLNSGNACHSGNACP